MQGEKPRAQHLTETTRTHYNAGETEQSLLSIVHRRDRSKQTAHSQNQTNIMSSVMVHRYNFRNKHAVSFQLQLSLLVLLGFSQSYTHHYAHTTLPDIHSGVHLLIAQFFIVAFLLFLRAFLFIAAISYQRVWWF